MQIKRLSPGQEDLWDSYVEQHPWATFFHRSGWKKVIENSMGHHGIYLMAIDNERIAGVYPLFIFSTGLFGKIGVSLPYVNYGGILADSPVVETSLVDEAVTIGRNQGCRYIELRQRFPLQINLPISEHKVLSIIPLNGGPEAVFGRLHQNVRNKIRKSEKNGVTVQKGPEYLYDFYRVFSRNLRDLGTPIMTRRFFENIAEKFPDKTIFYRATRQGKTIGARVTLVDQKTSYFYLSASQRESLQYAPVHAMNWAAIKDACATGCQNIDFGRVTSDSSHQNFKKYWGVESQTLPWAYQLLNCDTIPVFNKENPKFSLAISLWKKLPVFISRLLGPAIARRLP